MFPTVSKAPAGCPEHLPCEIQALRSACIHVRGRASGPNLNPSKFDGWKARPTRPRTRSPRGTCATHRPRLRHYETAPSDDRYRWKPAAVGSNPHNPASASAPTGRRSESAWTSRSNADGADRLDFIWRLLTSAMSSYQPLRLFEDRLAAARIARCMAEAHSRSITRNSHPSSESPVSGEAITSIGTMNSRA